MKKKESIVIIDSYLTRYGVSLLPFPEVILVLELIFMTGRTDLYSLVLLTSIIPLSEIE